MRTEELGTRTQRGTDPPRTASAQIHVSLAVPVPGTLGTLRSFFQLPRYLCISERSTAEEESITRTRSTCGPRSRREAAGTASKAAAETRARQSRNAKAPPWSREPRDSDQGASGHRRRHRRRFLACCETRHERALRERAEVPRSARRVGCRCSCCRVSSRREGLPADFASSSLVDWLSLSALFSCSSTLELV